MNTVLIIMRKNSVEFVVRDAISIIASGTDTLKSTNGDYDSLLSNIVNVANNHCSMPTTDFIFRKG